MSSINFNIRMDENLKARAFPIIESYGLTPAQAVKLFFHQIADTHTLPLSFQHKAGRLPNLQTQQSLYEAREEFANAKRYDSLDDMMKDIVELSE